jgi:hypothetical protein
MAIAIRTTTTTTKQTKDPTTLFELAGENVGQNRPICDHSKFECSLAKPPSSQHRRLPSIKKRDRSGGCVILCVRLVFSPEASTPPIVVF